LPCPVVAAVGRDAEALDELQWYLWCRGILAFSSTRLQHAAALSTKGGVLVLYADQFARAKVVEALRAALRLELAAVVLVTARAATFRSLERHAEGGGALVVLPDEVRAWTVLYTVRACLNLGTRAQA
jgi:hypothetical protein